MDSKKIDPAAVERAKRALERTVELFDAFADFEEPVCSKCGRVIYCGVNKLCSDNECGLKNAK